MALGVKKEKRKWHQGKSNITNINVNTKTNGKGKGKGKN